MFWNPRFVSPIAIRFSFGRGLRDATRRGTWSRLRWVARDVRAPGRSHTGPMRACLYAQRPGVPATGTLDPRLHGATGYLLPTLSGLPDSAALISSLVAQRRGATRLPKSTLCGLPLSPASISSFVARRGIARLPKSTLCGLPVSRALTSSFVREPACARASSVLVGMGSARAPPIATVERATAAMSARLGFENIAGLRSWSRDGLAGPSNLRAGLAGRDEARNLSTRRRLPDLWTPSTAIDTADTIAEC